MKRQRQIISYHLCVESKNKTNKYLTKQKQTYIYREQTCGYQWEERRRGGGRQEYGIERYKQHCLDILYSMGKYYFVIILKIV